MARRFDTTDPGFEEGFALFVAAQRESNGDVDDVVTEIIRDVRERGDAALFDLTQRFDGLTLTSETMVIGADERRSAMKRADPECVTALEIAAERIKAYHARQVPADERYTDDQGVELGHRWTALEAVGMYVPGGTASYPSSVLMNAVPARVAGVERLVMVVPSPGGEINPLVLAAAEIAGVTEIYRVGGAQAIAALAYGTETIAPVAKIVGPGNAYVAAAKRQVFGTVGIDMIAGPSEILVVADGANDPSWIAADLLSQAEHDESSQAILITDDPAFADAVVSAIDGHLKTLSRATIARASWENFGAVITVPKIDDAVRIVDRIAPEHLEVALPDEAANLFVARVRNAGSVFLGRYTPEAVGDYVGGPNHVLPTAGNARFDSGLTVLDFMKRTSILRSNVDSLAHIGPAAVRLAKAEGLDAHARSIAIRLNLPATD